MKTLFTALIVVATAAVYGQEEVELPKIDKKELKEAKALLRVGNYIDAYDIYWELYESYTEHADINFGVGVCKLKRRGEEKEALPYLIKACNNEKNKEALFYLGRAYHLNHKLSLAISMYEEYKFYGKGAIPKSEVENSIITSIKAKELIANPRNVEIVNLGETINTENQEIVPVVLSNNRGIMFTSRRKGGFNNQKDHQGNYYQDIYYAAYDNNTWQTPVNVNELNSELHDASVSVSSNGSTFIFFRTNENITGGDLYYTINKDGKWQEAVKFGENINSQYQEPSACLSPDENTLYFSSNRPGGYGGFDLYKVQKLPTGKWGYPMNLGPNINSEEDEDAPFMHADGKTLYFSSTGHQGMGGFDIFKTVLQDNNIWSTPENLGYPINTVVHDLYFTLSEDGKNAYYSSDRQGGLGKDDIYQIKMLDVENYQNVVNCVITDAETKEPIKAKVTLIDQKTHKINGVYRSNASNGKFILVILPEVNYQMIVEAKGYESKIIYKNYIEDELSTVDQFTLKPISDTANDQ